MLERYLRATMRCQPTEEVRGLFLDQKNGLISDLVLGRGTVSQVALYPRDVVRAALALDASGLILVHNHPSGDPTPSAADLSFTHEVAWALHAVGMALHDHVIVGHNRLLSLRSSYPRHGSWTPRERLALSA